MSLCLQDIAAKIMAFCEQGPRTVCILSAIGPIRNVTIRQPPSASTLSGPDVSYEVSFTFLYHCNPLNIHFQLFVRFSIMVAILGCGSSGKWGHNCGCDAVSVSPKTMSTV